MRELREFLAGFVYAWRGAAACVRRERNFRIHIVAAVTVLIFSLIYGVTALQGAVLTLTVTAVLSLEAVNTAVEAAVDLAERRSRTAALAKDAAAGAVLISAVGSVLVAVLVFSDTIRLTEAFKVILSFPWIIITVLYIAISVYFVFGIKSKGEQ